MTLTRHPVRALAIATVVLVLAAWLPPALRWIALPLVLFVPGAAVLLAALGVDRPASWFGRVGASGALSMVVLVLASGAAAAPGNSFDRARVVLGVGLVTAAALVVAALRSRRRSFAATEGEPDVDGDRGSWLLGPVLGLVATAIVTVGILAVAARLADGIDDAGFVVARFPGAAPTDAVTPTRDNVVTLAVALDNRDHGTRALTVDARATRGKPTAAVPVRLAPDATTTTVLQVPVPAKACNAKVVVTVRDTGTKAVVARLTRWVTPAAQCANASS